MNAELFREMLDFLDAEKCFSQCVFHVNYTTWILFIHNFIIHVYFYLLRTRVLIMIISPVSFLLSNPVLENIHFFAFWVYGQMSVCLSICGEIFPLKQELLFWVWSSFIEHRGLWLLKLYANFCRYFYMCIFLGLGLYVGTFFWRQVLCIFCCCCC